MSELIPAELEDLRPDTFVAVDVELSKGSEARFVGTFKSWQENGPGEPVSIILEDATDNQDMDILASGIVMVWWAPLGYRPGT
jgi:hypothetical protein